MKKQLFFFLSAALTVSCNSNYCDHPAVMDPVMERMAHTVFIPSKGAQDLCHILDPYGAGAQHFLVSSLQRSELRGRRGTIIHFDPAQMETTDGRGLNGQVEISLLELHNKSEFLRHNVSTTSNGRLLVSGGAYHISCRSGGKDVQLKKGMSLRITIPKIAKHEMCLFYGQRNEFGMLNWEPANRCFSNPADTMVRWKELVVDAGNKDSLLRSTDPHFIDASCFKNTNTELLDPGGAPVKEAMESSLITDPIDDTKKYCESTCYETISIDRLGWINCDYYYNGPTNGSVSVHVPPMRYGAFIRTYVVMHSMNSILQYNLYGSEHDGQQFIQGIPDGQDVTVIAFSYYEGKLYAFSSELKAGQNISLEMNLQPASDQQVSKMMGLAGHG